MLTKIEVATISPHDEEGILYKVIVHRKPTLLGKLFRVRPRPAEYFGENMTWYTMPDLEECGDKMCFWLFDMWEQQKYAENREKYLAIRARAEASTREFEEKFMGDLG